MRLALFHFGMASLFFRYLALMICAQLPIRQMYAH